MLDETERSHHANVERPSSGVFKNISVIERRTPPIVTFQGTKDDIQRDYDLSLEYIRSHSHPFKKSILTSLNNVKEYLIDGDWKMPRRSSKTVWNSGIRINKSDTRTLKYASYENVKRRSDAMNPIWNPIKSPFTNAKVRLLKQLAIVMKGGESLLLSCALSY